ncbi:hypothetical protein GmarT_48290 [Gimesia maris]|uniref:Uncharacterized protein n=1 Tax=Gimesia maris TaxID=122 RepID=A0ABX5YT30_9PLAN|nr:hypothetical protein GmarT_48290 [Gimesia maris]
MLSLNAYSIVTIPSANRQTFNYEFLNSPVNKDRVQQPFAVHGKFPGSYDAMCIKVLTNPPGYSTLTRESQGGIP